MPCASSNMQNCVGPEKCPYHKRLHMCPCRMRVQSAKIALGPRAKWPGTQTAAGAARPCQAAP
eukprot:9167090-Lingulodinium_polyedra.AAC.1